MVGCLAESLTYTHRYRYSQQDPPVVITTKIIPRHGQMSPEWSDHPQLRTTSGLKIIESIWNLCRYEFDLETSI